jgi:hypothetical protein
LLVTRTTPRTVALAFAAAFAFAFASAIAPAARADERFECASAAERAQTLRDAAKLRAASSELVTCARASCPTVVREDCAKWLAEVQGQMPSILVRARDARGRDVAGVRVLVDGTPLVARLEGVAVGIDPGPHRLRFEAAAGAVEEVDLVINETEKRRVVGVAFRVPLEVDGTAPSIGPEPAPPSERSTVPLYVVGGIGVAALVSFAFFEVGGQSHYAHLRDTCAPTHSCDPADRDAAHAELVAGVVSLATAAVAAGVFTWLVLRSDTPRRAAIAAW